MQSPQWMSRNPHTQLCYHGMGSKRKATFSFSLPSFLHYSISPTPVRIERTNSGQKIPKWHGEILFPGYATSTPLQLQCVGRVTARPYRTPKPAGGAPAALVGEGDASGWPRARGSWLGALPVLFGRLSGALSPCWLIFHWAIINISAMSPSLIVSRGYCV